MVQGHLLFKFQPVACGGGYKIIPLLLMQNLDLCYACETQQGIMYLNVITLLLVMICGMHK
jgi:hypothetical protein